MSDKPQINLPDMCQTHQWLLVSQAGYKETDPWRALVIVSQVALFQAVTTDKRIQEILARDITRVATLGCLACQKPDAFGKIVEAAKTHELLDIKRLGEKWVKDAAESD